MGKSCGLKKVEKKGEKCPFNVLRCKSCKKKKKKKKIRHLVFFYKYEGNRQAIVF